MKASINSGKRLQSSAAFLLLLMAIGFIATGCSDDTAAPETPPADFSGYWNYTYEVIEKRACGRDVGAQSYSAFLISQFGNQATVVIDNEIAVDLTINGSHATGSGGNEGVLIDLDLTLADGIMSGTVSFSLFDLDCTEVWSIDGYVLNETPSPDLAGNWELDIVIDSSDCEGETVGSRTAECVTIFVASNTVWINDDEGTIVGVGDGESATMYRITDTEYLRVEIAFNDDGSFFGFVSYTDLVTGCEIRRNVDGIKRATACPPPLVPAKVLQ